MYSILALRDFELRCSSSGGRESEVQKDVRAILLRWRMSDVSALRSLNRNVASIGPTQLASSLEKARDRCGRRKAQSSSQASGVGGSTRELRNSKSDRKGLKSSASTELQGLSIHFSG